MNKAAKLFNLSKKTLSNAFMEFFVPDLNPMSRRLTKIFENQSDKDLYIRTMKELRNNAKEKNNCTKKTITLSNDEKITVSL